jgi:hypothetical protein
MAFEMFLSITRQSPHVSDSGKIPLCGDIRIPFVSSDFHFTVTWPVMPGSR